MRRKGPPPGPEHDPRTGGRAMSEEHSTRSSEPLPTKHRNRAESPPHDDCFVVISDRGGFWDGSRWVKDYRAAWHFTATLFTDPWLACDLVCRDLRTVMGWYGAPAFFPRSKNWRAQRPPRPSAAVAPAEPSAPTEQPAAAKPARVRTARARRHLQRQQRQSEQRQRPAIGEKTGE